MGLLLSQYAGMYRGCIGVFLALILTWIIVGILFVWYLTQYRLHTSDLRFALTLILILHMKSSFVVCNLFCVKKKSWCSLPPFVGFYDNMLLYIIVQMLCCLIYCCVYLIHASYYYYRLAENIKHSSTVVIISSVVMMMTRRKKVRTVLRNTTK